MEAKRFRISNAMVLSLAGALAGCDPAAGSDFSDDSQGSGKSDAAEPVASTETAMMVHLFNWRFDDVSAELSRLAAIGYTHVLVSPPNLTTDHDQWWGRYQPIDYRVIDGPLGDREAFEAMIDEAESLGIRIVVDVVFNHMANLEAGDPSFDLSFPPQEQIASYVELYAEQYGIDVSSKLFDAGNFHPAQCIDWASHEEMGPYQVQRDVRDNRLCGGEDDPGLPDLDQEDPRVLEVQQAYLQMLRDMNVGGYRFDAIKHMEPDYAARVVTPEALPEEPIVFGEIIAGAPEWDRDIAPYWEEAPSYFKFYDFPLVKTMLRAFGPDGDLRELSEDLIADRRAMPSSKAVTFVVNHDIPQNGFIFGDMLFGGNQGDDKHPGDYGDPTLERLASAFVLGRAGGIPLIYSDPGKSETADIKSDAYHDAHCDASTVRMLRFRSTVAGAQERPLYADAYRLAFARGDRAFVAINNFDSPSDIPLKLEGLRDGDYVDALSGRVVTVRDEALTEGDLELPALDAAMFVELELAEERAMLDGLDAAICERSATEAIWADR